MGHVEAEGRGRRVFSLDDEETWTYGIIKWKKRNVITELKLPESTFSESEVDFGSNQLTEVEAYLANNTFFFFPE